MARCEICDYCPTAGSASHLGYGGHVTVKYYPHHGKCYCSTCAGYIVEIGRLYRSMAKDWLAENGETKLDEIREIPHRQKTPALSEV